MSVARPKFIDSPYFYSDERGWHLKPGAPKDVQEEFDAFMAPLPEDEDGDTPTA